MAKRKRYLFVCSNRRPDGTPRGSCAQRGAIEVHALLKARLKAEGLGELEARACTASCLDVCWAGPVISVSPDGYFYGHVTVDDVEDIILGLKEGKPVSRLVLGPADFLEPREVKTLSEEELARLASSDEPAASTPELHLPRRG